jgi:deoxyribonuclease-1
MRLRAALAALLLFPNAALAQYRAGRVVVPRATPIAPVPALPGALPGASLTAPSLSAALVPTLSASVLAAPALSPAVAGQALPAAPPAPLAAAPAALSAPVDAPRIPGAPGSELPGGALPDGLDAPARTAPTLRDWLRRYGKADPVQSAALLAAAFDGRRSVRASDGTEFEAVPDPRNGVRFVRTGLAAPAQPAPGRTVPGTDGLAGRALFDAVARAARTGQRQHEYSEASDYLFATADNVTLGGVRGVVDAYSGVFVAGSSPDGRDYPEPGDRNHDGHVDEGMNVEHIWPQGHFDKALPMRSDLHHLMATFIHPNGVRGNMPFGVVRGRVVYRNDAGTKSDGSVFEPADFSKGRVARAMLYFYSRYKGQNIFSDPRGARWWEGQIEVLMDWNRRFPPDAGERRRNDLVERYQGNRNPFVDDHLLADRIGAEAFRHTAPRSARDARDRGGRESKGFRRGSRFSGRRR